MPHRTAGRCRQVTDVGTNRRCAGGVPGRGRRRRTGGALWTGTLVTFDVYRTSKVISVGQVIGRLPLSPTWRAERDQFDRRGRSVQAGVGDGSAGGFASTGTASPAHAHHNGRPDDGHLRPEARSPAALRGGDARGRRPRGVRLRRRRQARLQRVALGPAPGGDRGRRRGGEGPEPLSGPALAPSAPADRRALRHRSGAGRGGQRLLRDPARRGRRAVRARRRDPVRLAGVLDLPSPGRALRGPRDPRPARRGLRSRPRRDARRGHLGDPARLRLQSQQPHRHAPSRRAESRSSAPGSPTTSRWRSTRRTSSSRPTTTPMPPSTCSRTSRTWSSCARSARCTGSPACAAATRCARPSSAARSTPCASRSASTSWLRRPPPRRSCTPTTSPSASSERSSSESSSRRDCASWASSPRARRPTSPGSRSATSTRPR